MFYKMIENKCTQWYESERCTVKNLIEYIEKTGQMRDAQIEAIKVSWINLFLKFVLFCLCRLVKKVGTVEVLQVLFFLKKETAQPIWYYRHLVDACVR